MDIQREPKSKRGRYIKIGAAVVAVILVTVALSRLEPAPPSVPRATLWVDTVVRGTLIDDVAGPGTLVPVEVQWISAVTAGRIERIEVMPGIDVTASTVLLELANPQVEIQALQAEQQLTNAEAALVDLRVNLRSAILSQQATIADVRARYAQARLDAENNEVLAADGIISEAELAMSRESAEALATRLDIAQQRLELLQESMDGQIAAQEQQVERLRAGARVQRDRVESMVVRAGVEGVLVELSSGDGELLQEGQWVTSGQTLARIIKPRPLKAVVRIPEAQAVDVAIGQRAYVDTRNDTIPGRVVRMDPAAEAGTVTVDIRLEGPLPESLRSNLSVQATIVVARLEDVLKVGRPAYGRENSPVGLFKLVDGGDAAVRTRVQLGAAAVNEMEVRQGLQEGDVVILSDMSQYDDVDRVRIQ